MQRHTAFGRIKRKAKPIAIAGLGHGIMGFAVAGVWHRLGCRKCVK